MIDHTPTSSSLASLNNSLDSSNDSLDKTPLRKFKSLIEIYNSIFTLFISNQEIIEKEE